MSILDSAKLSRLKEGLAKTRKEFFSRVNRLIFASTTIDADFLGELEEILIGADVGVDTSNAILSSIKARAKDRRYQNSVELDAIVRESIADAIGEKAVKNVGAPFAIPQDAKPYVIMVVGVNGVGKTTTIGKLAFNYRSSGYRVLMGAADTFRAAAHEQLEIWARRAGVEMIGQAHGSDPAAVAFDTLKAAKARDADVVIVDTAGRLHTKSNLMEELKKVKRVMQKCNPSTPHEVLLVIDASTGQNAIQQAKQFDNAVGLTGLVVTKLDGTAKGGVILAIMSALKIPVRYIGVGEQIDDLQPFRANDFIDALFEKEVV